MPKINMPTRFVAVRALIWGACCVLDIRKKAPGEFNLLRRLQELALLANRRGAAL
jgi:hypothetical protein